MPSSSSNCQIAPQPSKPLFPLPMFNQNKSISSNNKQISLPPISSIIKNESYPQTLPPPLPLAQSWNIPHREGAQSAPLFPVPSSSTPHHHLSFSSGQSSVTRVSLPFELPPLDNFQFSYNHPNDYHYNLQNAPLIRKASPLTNRFVTSPISNSFNSPVNNTFAQASNSSPVGYPYASHSSSAPQRSPYQQQPPFNKVNTPKVKKPVAKKSPSNDKVFAFISHSIATYPSQEPSIDNAQLARRKRRRTSSHELSILQNEFELGSNPNRLRRQEIAVKVKMDEKAVQIWFQNKRQSIKRFKLKNDSKNLSNTTINEVSNETETDEFKASTRSVTPTKENHSSVSSTSSTPSKSCLTRSNSYEELTTNQTTITASNPTTPNKTFFGGSNNVDVSGKGIEHRNTSTPIKLLKSVANDAGSSIVLKLDKSPKA